MSKAALYCGMILIAMTFIVPFSAVAAILEVGPIGYPYASIQEAIDAAGTNDTVLVHNGTYVENISISGKKITVVSDNGPAATIIDGGGSGPVVYLGTGDSTIEGFTIQNGVSTNIGGGIYCFNSSPTIIDCTVIGNSATFTGGGIYCSSASPTITDCRILGNSAGSGGGIYVTSTSSPTIIESLIDGNSASGYAGFGYGGGIYCDSSTALTITNSTISNNSADNYSSGTLAGWGGGIYCIESSSLTITESIISGNSAIDHYDNQKGKGGGIYCNAVLSMINCIVSDNRAGDAVEEGEGGGIHLHWDSDADIINTTIVENEADLGAGIFYHACNPTVVNSVLWGNAPDAIGHYPTSGGIAITYSDIEGGGYAGAGNIAADPLFADNAYHLAPNSPCIDAGTVSGAPETDYEGDPRLTAVGGDNQPDMGADEFIPPLPDLIVESITTVPVDPDPDEAFTVYVTIKNQGEGNFSGLIRCAYALTPPPSIYSRWYIWNGLNAGASSVKEFFYADGRPVGTYTLQAIADDGASVTESNEANNSRSTTLQIDALPDTVPPSPDPMTWSVVPYETSTSAVSMTATTASDPTPPVEYFFACVVPGCHSSSWQPGTVYTDSGLLPNTSYGWRVKARDGSANETSYSPASYDYTDIETPSGVSFSIDVGSTYIYARSANTPSGLDRGGSGLILYNLITATDSGWKQDNDWWLSDGLSPNTSYIFRARARNGDGDETLLSNYYYRLTRAAMPGADSFSNITPTSIQANWAANGNPPGTEYYCESKISATNSGWTTDTFWDSTGLACGQLHAFRVRARNAEGFTTDWTALGDQATLPCQSACEGDFEPDGDVDGSDLAEEVRTLAVDIAVFAGEFGRTNCP